MTNFRWSISSKFILIAILSASLVGFWYFEPSLFLRIIVLIFSLAGLIIAFSRSDEKPTLVSKREFLILLMLYLGLFSLYNLLYGLSIPLYLVMIAVLLLVSGLFFNLLVLDKLETVISPPLFWVFIVMMGLIILEIFLSLSFWPVDPKTKSLIIVVIFYLTTNFIYLYSHNVLKLKRIAGFLIVGLLILALLIFNIWMSLRS